MDISRINYLKGESANESLAYNEVAEIEEAFRDIPDDWLDDSRENATTDDMLNELEKSCSTVEKTIYAWIKENFGESEANDPSYSISALAEEINKVQIIRGAGNGTIGALLGE